LSSPPTASIRRLHACSAGEPFLLFEVRHIRASALWECSRSHGGHQDWSSISARCRRGKRTQLGIFPTFDSLVRWRCVGKTPKNNGEK
jgi:hypothetical protein